MRSAPAAGSTHVFIVKGHSVNFLIDCGASACRRPNARHRARRYRSHPDHGISTAIILGGLPFLLLDAQFTRRTRPLVIAGPIGIETRLLLLMETLFEAFFQNKAAVWTSRWSRSNRREPHLRRRESDALSSRAWRIRRTVSGYRIEAKAASLPTAPIPNGRRR